MSEKQYDNNNTGALFRNDKDGNEKRPDYRGQAEINRVEYWVSAFLRTSKKGDKFMSLRFEPKQASQVKGGAANPPAQKAAAQDFNDDIPFAWAIALPTGLLIAMAVASPLIA